MNKLFFDPENLPVIDTTKATKVADGLLLSQYSDSPLFRAYLQAFVDEMDLLYYEIENVYYFRMLEYAEGTQLDVIGIILDETRGVDLPVQFFGFNDEFGPATPNVAPLADEATPLDGGIFKSEEQSGTSSYQMNDIEYKRLLLAKAMVSSNPTCDVDFSYSVLTTLIGRTPQVFRYVISPQSVELEMTASDTALADSSLISYFSKYLIPLGTTFSVTRI